MNIIRIGNKLIDGDRIKRQIDKILKMRSEGLSQTEIAAELNLERTFISRLENLGEIRKGKKIGLVAFPIKNKNEIIELANKEGLDFVLIMNEKERWKFVEDKSGIDLFNEIMKIISTLSSFDLIIFAGSDKRIPLIERILDTQIISLCIGKSPITEDITLPTDKLINLIAEIRKD